MPKTVRPQHPRDLIGKTWAVSDDVYEPGGGYKHVNVTLTGQQVFDLWQGIHAGRPAPELWGIVGATSGSSSVWNRATGILRRYDFIAFDSGDRTWKSRLAGGVSDNRLRLFHADAFDLLSGLADGSVDCIITDPPYESLEKHRAKGTTTRLKVSDASSNEWFPVIPNACFPRLFAELHRVLRKNAHLYVYCDAETMFEAKPAAEAAGFKFWKPLVWDKATIGMGYHYRARCEFILFFEKGKRKLNDLGIPDVLDDETCDVRLGLSPGESLRLREPRVRDGYPTEKPVPVSRVLIRQSTVDGELVLDPFMGSGSVGHAALVEGRRFIGGDVKPNAVELAWSRLRPLTAP